MSAGEVAVRRPAVAPIQGKQNKEETRTHCILPWTKKLMGERSETLSSAEGGRGRCLWEERLPIEIRRMILSFLRGDCVATTVCRFVSKEFRDCVEDHGGGNVKRFSELAAASGHLGVLKWARENGCPWDEATLSCAAEEAGLATLRWCRENGCPWDTTTCAFAARGGHLTTLRWVRENGCP